MWLPHVEQEPRLAGARIVLAEDDAEVRRLLASALEKDGHEIVLLRDGAALVAALSVPQILEPGFRTPDLVITDHRMPLLTGLDALSMLRRGGWTIPVLLITAFGDPLTHQDARRLGAAAVLDKPFDLLEFRVVVATLLSMSRTTARQA